MLLPCVVNSIGPASGRGRRPKWDCARDSSRFEGASRRHDAGQWAATNAKEHTQRERRRRWCPWRDSNPRTWLRRPVLYPLSYRGLSDRSFRQRPRHKGRHPPVPAGATIPAHRSRRQPAPAPIACRRRPWRTTAQGSAATSELSRPSSGWRRRTRPGRSAPARVLSLR